MTHLVGLAVPHIFLHDDQYLMTTPCSCLRYGYRLLQGSHRIQSYSYVSLRCDTQHNNGPQRIESEPQPVYDHDKPRFVNAVHHRGDRFRDLKRAPQRPSEDDPALEALFSSKQEQLRENSRTRHSRTPFTNAEDRHGLPEMREKAKLQNPISVLEKTSDHAGVANRLDQVIAGLQQREKQIADLITEARSLLWKIKPPSPSDEGSLTLNDVQIQTKERDDTSKARRVTTLIKNLTRATDRYDVAWVVQLWRKFERSPDHTQLDLNSRETLYIHFLSAFFELSRQEQAIQVWNDMLQSNITPNEKHWNTMLKGCSKAHDIRSLQGVWSNMISTGVEPDQMLWTTYIHGLIMCGRWQQGLQVLDNLGARWNAAKKHRASKSPPSTETLQPRENQPLNKYDPNTPSLAPVQGAITALTVTQRHSLCLPLLKWATSHSIPLTTEIFNILLRPAVRTSDTAKIQKILSLMHAHSCPADEATYTILLDGHLSSSSNNSDHNTPFSHLSPTEQKDSILKILDDMTTHGISIDRRTYGTILRSLLSPQRGLSSEDAVRAVLAHMSANNILPDSYIYHMLITHHFSATPPDIPAIESIWKQIKLERPNLQSVFYEKMVEGYASVRMVERMMFFLRRIVQEGNSPRWGCLVVVLRTLIEVGEWELVRELVADVQGVKGSRGLMKHADEGVASLAKEEFWGIVEGLR
ncbi:MAG: hypothetical protein L6R41_006831 [Letrouitia leprolyta]|nr:MAG: hypothetical protein L6R41_006831 [Letrouitia leprolyta]